MGTIEFPAGDGLAGSTTMGDDAYSTIETLIQIQQAAMKYRSLAGSGRFDADTSRLLLELAEMVETKAREVDAAGKH
jgi:hypothetical protein